MTPVTSMTFTKTKVYSLEDIRQELIPMNRLFDCVMDQVELIKSFQESGIMDDSKSGVPRMVLQGVE